MRFTQVPDEEDDGTPVGAYGGVAGFDTPAEVSLFDQLVREHQQRLLKRLLEHMEPAEEKRTKEQLLIVNQWLDELNKEPDGS